MSRINQCCLPPFCYTMSNHSLEGFLGCCYYKGSPNLSPRSNPQNDPCSCYSGENDCCCCGCGFCCLLPNELCDNMEICISPCFCCCKVGVVEKLPGDTNSKEINEYIKKNGIRTRKDTYIYNTFGRFKQDEGPIIQTMTNIEVGNLINNKLVEQVLQTMSMGEGEHGRSLSGIIAGMNE